MNELISQQVSTELVNPSVSLSFSQSVNYGYLVTVIRFTQSINK